MDLSERRAIATSLPDRRRRSPGKYQSDVFPIRRGQAVYIVGADPVGGLELRAASHFDIYGAADPPYTYRIERAGPSSTRWETRVSGEVLHLRWLVDHARPWAGVSPLQHAVELQIAQADSPASAPRKDYQTLRFGANPPGDLIELRTRVCLDIGRACGIPRGLLDSKASGQASRESWRQWISTSVSGLARRIEAQLLVQLGVVVSINTDPLGGIDIQARAAAFRRLTEGGLKPADARQAAGI